MSTSAGTSAGVQRKTVRRENDRMAEEIVAWTIAHRVLALTTLVAASLLQPAHFDTSAQLLLSLDATSPSGRGRWLTRVASALTRWDTLHFLGVASPRPLPLPRGLVHDRGWHVADKQGTAAGGGLQHEHSLAWQPGIIWLLRLAGYRSLDGLLQSWSPVQAVLLVSLLATAVSCLLPVLLYRLTLLNTRSKTLARTAAYLSILSTSPSTLITPTPEPFFALFALLGHLSLESVSPLAAALFYAIATAFRANGIILAGFFVWKLIWARLHAAAAAAAKTTNSSLAAEMVFRIAVATPLAVAITLSPFILGQTWAYMRFCLDDGVTAARPWCTAALPLSYTFVQREYWDVAPFRYWTVAQLPNFLLAAPVLALCLRFCMKYFATDPRAALRLTLRPWRASAATRTQKRAQQQPEEDSETSEGVSVKATPSLLPHAHFTLLTTALLVVSSHVQIALRFASPGGLPAVWWAAADVLLSTKGHGGERAKRWLIGYLVIWNVVSLVLYAGFYPPA